MGQAGSRFMCSAYDSPLFGGIIGGDILRKVVPRPRICSEIDELERSNAWVEQYVYYPLAILIPATAAYIVLRYTL